jgi:acyl-CoA thioester hydrolase
MRETAPHRLFVRVYYEDTDFSGVVYHARYLHFLERGRTEWLRDCGIDQRSLFDRAEGPPVALVVTHMTIDFRKPARMDDRVTVETMLLSLGRASLVLGQRVLRDATPLVEARVKVAALAGGKVARLPAALMAAVAADLPAGDDPPQHGRH